MFRTLPALFLIAASGVLAGCRSWQEVVPSYRLVPEPVGEAGPLQPIPAAGGSTAAEIEPSASGDAMMSSGCVGRGDCGWWPMMGLRPTIWHRLWWRCREWRLGLPPAPWVEEEPEPPWPRFHPVPTRPVFAPLPDMPLSPVSGAEEKRSVRLPMRAVEEAPRPDQFPRS